MALDRATILKAIKVAHSQGQTEVVEELAATLPPVQNQADQVAAKFNEPFKQVAPSSGPTGLIDRMRGHVTDGIEAVATSFDPQPVDNSNVRPDIAAKFGDTARPSPMEGVRTAGAGALRGVAGAAMELVPEPIKEAVGAVAGKVVELPPVDAAIKTYTSAKKEYPDYFKAFEDSLAISTAALPNAKFTTRTNFGNKIIKSQKEPLLTSRIDKAKDFFAPKNFKGPGEFQINPKTGVKEYVPTGWEQEFMSTAAREKAFQPSKSYTENMTALREAARADSRKLVEDMVKRGNPKVDMKGLTSHLDDLAENIADMEGGFSLTSATTPQAQKFVTFIKNELKKTDGTAVSVLDLRKRLDAKIRIERPNVFNPDFENAASIANRFVRDALNDSVDKAMGPFSVKKRLTKESHLFSAADRLEAKARADAETTMGRLFTKLQKTLPGVERLPTTPLAQAATLGYGASLIAGSPLIAAGTTGLVALAAGYKGGKWLLTPDGKIWMGRMIKAIEKDPLASSLKADRLALIDLMNQPAIPQEEAPEGKPQASINKESLVYAGMADPWTTKRGQELGSKITNAHIDSPVLPKVQEAWTNRMENMVGDRDAFQRGEINRAELGLRGAGEALGATGDLMGSLVEPLIPQFVMDGIADLARGVMSTEKAQQAAKWLEENPRAARNLGAAGNVLTSLPAAQAGRNIGRAAKTGVERTVKNFPIELPRFYAGGGRAGQAGALASVVPSAVYQTLTEFLDPRAIARAEQGISNQTRNVAKLAQKGKQAIKDRAALVEYEKQAKLKEAFDAGKAHNETRALYQQLGFKGKSLPKGATPAQQKLIDMPEGERSKLFPEKTKAEVARLRKAAQATKSNAEHIQEVFLKAYSKMSGKPYVPLKDKGASQFESFASGQLEYANLVHQQLNRGVKESPQVLKTLFNDMGIIESGTFGRETFAKAFSSYKPETWAGVVDDELIDTLTDIMDKAWAPSTGMKIMGGDKTGKLMIIKHPNMWDDFTQESRVAGSELNAIVNSKRIQEAARDAFGGARGFDTPEELKMFAALDSIVKTDNMKILDEDALAFLKSHKQLKAGKALDADAQRAYNSTRMKLEARAAQFKTDSQGRVYRKSNHNSASKTMGGVQNTTVFDQQGNIINLIHDEHDLFGMNLPWMSRMINISTPQVTNLFTGSKNIAEAADNVKKADFMRALKWGPDFGGVDVQTTAKGAPSTKKAALSDALEKGILNFQPQVAGEHVMRSGAVQIPNVYAQGGLLGSMGVENRERQKQRGYGK